MANNEVFEKIKSIVIDKLGIEDSKIKMEADIIKDFNADSLDLVELLMDVESEWDIIIEDEDVAELHTIEDVVNYIDSKVN